MNAKFRHFVIGTLGAGAALLVSALGAADTPADDSRVAGRASVYRQLSPESLEHVTTPERIKALGSGNVAPTEIWRALEHGEKVECLSCIPYVEKLLWNENAKTREISAWWLRRRIFGVFGPGEAYSRVVGKLQQGSETERTYAVEALGEFLSASGTRHVANAAITDSSAKVRKSAVHALTRLNSQGPNGELAAAIDDQDEDVRMAALHGSIRVNVFTHVDKVVAHISDPSARVRKRAAENLGVMRATDAVVGLVALTAPADEQDPAVRAAAVAALGQIGDAGGKAAVQEALNDPNQFVRDAAKIAQRRF
jgi:hypothetical protein